LSNRSHRCDPRKPAPPVTNVRTFTSASAILKYRALHGKQPRQWFFWISAAYLMDDGCRTFRIVEVITMSTFVLVHGAWHGGWCYKRVAEQLRKVGHEVYTPTLTGLGERSHLMSRAVNLDTHVQDIVNVIRWEELSEVVLCGHSYGGMVITGVADKVPEKILALVYLDAFVPKKGRSLMDFLPPDMQAGFADDVKNNGEGYLMSPIPAEVFKVNEQDAAWVNQMCVKHPLECFEQRITLTGALARVPRRTYVLATNWGPPQPFIEIAKRLKHDPGWTVISLPCGHDLMLDMPKETAEQLVMASA
jgi:pimeloyl-ACP methyl ester carboxylesterase